MPRMRYWLVKTEPSVYSIDDLAKDGATDWTGVRNYQARNFLVEMRAGDKVLVYHSNAEPPGVAGVAEVSEEAKPDKTQFDRKGEYFDEKATVSKPRWFCPELQFVSKLKRLVPLEQLRAQPALSGMALLQKGSRLSVTPVTADEFQRIVKLGAVKEGRR